MSTIHDSHSVFIPSISVSVGLYRWVSFITVFPVFGPTTYGYSFRHSWYFYMFAYRTPTLTAHSSTTNCSFRRPVFLGNIHSCSICWPFGVHLFIRCLPTFLFIRYIHSFLTFCSFVPIHSLLHSVRWFRHSFIPYRFHSIRPYGTFLRPWKFHSPFPFLRFDFGVYIHSFGDVVHYSVFIHIPCSSVNSIQWWRGISFSCFPTFDVLILIRYSHSYSGPIHSMLSFLGDSVHSFWWSMSIDSVVHSYLATTFLDVTFRLLVVISTFPFLLTVFIPVIVVGIDVLHHSSDFYFPGGPTTLFGCSVRWFDVVRLMTIHSHSYRSDFDFFILDGPIPTFWTFLRSSISVTTFCSFISDLSIPLFYVPIFLRIIVSDYSVSVFDFGPSVMASFSAFPIHSIVGRHSSISFLTGDRFRFIGIGPVLLHHSLHFVSLFIRLHVSTRPTTWFRSLSIHSWSLHSYGILFVLVPVHSIRSRFDSIRSVLFDVRWPVISLFDERGIQVADLHSYIHSLQFHFIHSVCSYLLHLQMGW
jgi:hypothetical protein